MGDLVTGLGGVRVREMADFAAVLGDIGPDNTLTFEILRGQGEEKMNVTFGRRPAGKRRTRTPHATDGQSKLDAPPTRNGLPASKATALDGERSGTSAKRQAAEPPPPPPPAPSPRSDLDRIQTLEERIRELESRLERVEQALLHSENETRKKP